MKVKQGERPLKYKRKSKSKRLTCDNGEDIIEIGKDWNKLSKLQRKNMKKIIKKICREIKRKIIWGNFFENI